MTTPQIRIVLADDHQLIRESWRMLLENNPRFKVVADCANGHDAIRSISEHNPDILLVDINMQPINGFEVVRHVVEHNPAVRIIGMSISVMRSEVLCLPPADYAPLLFPHLTKTGYICRSFTAL